MRILSAIFIAFASLTISSLASACPGASIELNPTTWLKPDGMYGSSGRERTTEEMEATIKQGKRAVFVSSDQGVKTHLVEFLGSVRDEGGVIQVIYVIKDAKTGVENTVVLKSSYRGNGIQARGADSPDNQLKTLKGFSTVQEAGCK